MGWDLKWLGRGRWSPTSDWAATGEVIEKRDEAGQVLNLQAYGMEHAASFYNGKMSIHEDVKVCICLAALAAVGVPQDVVDEAMKEQSNG